MSFQIPPRRARVARSVAMGGFMDTVDEVLQQASSTNPELAGWLRKTDPDVSRDLECLAAANTGAYVRQMDANRTDLVKHWQPSGLYTVEQVSAIINSTFAMLQYCIKYVDKAMNEPLAQGDRDALQMMRTNAQIRMGGAKDGMKWVNAKNAAIQQGVTLIDAPGLKRWVTASMLDASQCIVGVDYVLCKRPWFVGAMAGFMAIFNAVYSVCRAIVGVAIDVAKAAGQAILYVPDALATALKVGKWSVIGGLAYFFYKGEHHKLLARFK